MTRELELAQMLSEGLDLCVRARGLDDALRAAMVAGNCMGGDDDRTRCLTPALWVQEQYDTDLADWEDRARKVLLESGLASRTGQPAAISKAEGRTP